MLLAIIAILPMVFIVFSAFKTKTEYYNLNKLAPPGSFLNFSNFKTALIGGNMLIGLKNTALILAISLTGSILFGAMVAYVVNRFNFFGKKIILGLFFTAMLIPMVTTQVSTYQIVVNVLHLGDTIWLLTFISCFSLSVPSQSASMNPPCWMEPHILKYFSRLSFQI
jgi:multiple sugar transport system permease protein